MSKNGKPKQDRFSPPPEDTQSDREIRESATYKRELRELLVEVAERHGPDELAWVRWTFYEEDIKLIVQRVTRRLRDAGFEVIHSSESSGRGQGGQNHV